MRRGVITVRIYLRLVYLNTLAILSILRIGTVERRRLLRLFRSLTLTDKKLCASNVVRTLKQIAIARKREKDGTLSPLQDCLTRTSDRVFILGSGPSINDLSSSDFDEMSKSDSWGFNFWLVHDFVPDVYFAQVGTMRKLNVEVMEAWDSCFLKVADKYKNTKFVLKGGDLYYGFDVTTSKACRQLVDAGIPAISVLPTFLVPKDMTSTARELFDELLSVELMAYASGLRSPVPQIRSTVGLLIVLAIQMGYKEVVLCGIDGKNRDHFYDQEAYLKAYPELKAVPESYKVNDHPHSIPEKSGISALDYLVVLSEYCKDRFGVEIKIASDKSYLSGKLPYYSSCDDCQISA